MRLQLLSDLHLETESFEPVPAPDAELLVLAGDIDSTWAGFERFRGWPVPMVLIAGNHEFDGREITQTWSALRELCDEFGALLIFDEVVTGFRLGLGGAQGYFGVRPDVTIFGKLTVAAINGSDAPGIPRW